MATADSVILDRCRGWLNLSALAVALEIPDARVLDLAELGL